MTSLRTSAWEATSQVAKQNFAQGRHGDRKRKRSLNNLLIAAPDSSFGKRNARIKQEKALLFIFWGEKEKNTFLATQEPCLSVGILVVIPLVDN